MILALETATEAGGVALLDGSDPIAECATGPGPPQAGSLLRAIDELLAESGLALEQVDLIALSVGPGSFTGLRVGLATALGLSFGQPLKIAPVSTLAALSLHAGNRLRIAPVLDARKSQIYAGLYARDAVPVFPDRLADPDEWAESLRGSGRVHLLGSGADLYRERFAAALGADAEFLPESRGRPRAVSVGRLGGRIARRGAALLPEQVRLRYLRAADAKLPDAAGQARGEAIP